VSVRILIGDMRQRLAELPDNSVDSVVCDPPYHLTSIVKRFGAANAAPAKSNGATGAYGRASKGFMGQTWDGGDVAFDPETWAEVLRVIKPGGHLLAFSGTRTYHRMAVAIEDAGFEVRDMIAWHYGSGFPKSLDVSKAIDKRSRNDFLKAAVELGLYVPSNNLHDWIKGGHSIGDVWWEKFKTALSEKDWKSVERRVIGKQSRVRSASVVDVAPHSNGEFDITAPATDAAREWEGYGTALKPATEPICLARKPLSEKSVAANVLKWGTGALNIDGCRVEHDEPEKHTERTAERKGSALNLNTGKSAAWVEGTRASAAPEGRWPANLIHDGSDEVVAGFPETESGSRTGGISADSNRTVYGSFKGCETARDYVGDSGSAARFFGQFQYGEEEWEFVKSVHAARSAESLCGSCGTPIAGTPAATLTLASIGAASQAGPDSIGICGRCILSLSPAPSAESLENIATIPTIPSCSKSNGSAQPATASTIRADARARVADGSDPEQVTRFRYCPKATTEERGEGNNHPTVKPVALMRWLVRLVTPKGGTVLDPFSGSGSTLIAADMEQFNAIGCELSADYAAIAEQRLRDAGGMFADVQIAA
jgi:DNA modification methylase